MFWRDLGGRRDGLGSLWWIINGYKSSDGLCGWALWLPWQIEYGETDTYQLPSPGLKAGQISCTCLLQHSLWYKLVPHKKSEIVLGRSSGHMWRPWKMICYLERETKEQQGTSYWLQVPSWKRFSIPSWPHVGLRWTTQMSPSWSLTHKIINNHYFKSINGEGWEGSILFGSMK